MGVLIRVRGIRTDYDIPGRDAEGVWIGVQGFRRDHMLRANAEQIHNDEQLYKTFKYQELILLDVRCS